MAKRNFAAAGRNMARVLAIGLGAMTLGSTTAALAQARPATQPATLPMFLAAFQTICINNEGDRAAQIRAATSAPYNLRPSPTEPGYYSNPIYTAGFPEAGPRLPCGVAVWLRDSVTAADIARDLMRYTRGKGSAPTMGADKFDYFETANGVRLRYSFSVMQRVNGGYRAMLLLMRPMTPPGNRSQ